MPVRDIVIDRQNVGGDHLPLGLNSGKALLHRHSVVEIDLQKFKIEDLRLRIFKIFFFPKKILYLVILNPGFLQELIMRNFLGRENVVRQAAVATSVRLHVPDLHFEAENQNYS